MNKACFFLFCISLAIILSPTEVFAQQKTFDLVTYTPPKGWTKQTKETFIAYSVVDNKNKAWCQISIFKSTASKGDIDSDFESEWATLVAKQYAITEAPHTTATEEAEGWKIKAGTGKFLFNKKEAAAILTTFSGYGICVSILATTGNQRYINDIEAFVSSLDLKKPVTNPQQTPVAATSSKFTFTTSNFDDGWTSVVQEDWVQVTKENIKVLIHYPNKKADDYNPSLLDGLKKAWEVLVAPRYSISGNIEFKPISGWQSVEFAEADAVEKVTGKTVHIVLFKMNYSGGNGKYLEFITSDKKSFEAQFGAYHQNSFGWEKMEAMANYNKFAVAVADLKGKWTSNFSGTTQYVNAYTGLDAGMNTHASNENYEFTLPNTYKWDLGVASGMVGNIKFQSVKSAGKFLMKDNWHIYLSDIEGKPRTYDAWFSCIKGLRILWIGNTAFAKKE